MSIKLRVYEVARDLGLDNKALVALLQSVGVPDVRNHMSAVPPEVVERVKRHIEKQKQQKSVEERIRPTVVKRRAAPRASEASAPSHPVPVATPSVVHREDAPRAPQRAHHDEPSRPLAAPAPVSQPVREAPPSTVQVREREVVREREAEPPAPPVAEAPRSAPVHAELSHAPAAPVPEAHVPPAAPQPAMPAPAPLAAAPEVAPHAPVVTPLPPAAPCDGGARLVGATCEPPIDGPEDRYRRLGGPPWRADARSGAARSDAASRAIRRQSSRSRARSAASRWPTADARGSRSGRPCRSACAHARRRARCLRARSAARSSARKSAPRTRRSCASRNRSGCKAWPRRSAPRRPKS